MIIIQQILLLPYQIEVLVHNIHEVDEPFHKDVEGSVGEVVSDSGDAVHVVSQGCEIIDVDICDLVDLESGEEGCVVQEHPF